MISMAEIFSSSINKVLFLAGNPHDYPHQILAIDIALRIVL